MLLSTYKFGILNFGHCDFFGICDLIFLAALVKLRQSGTVSFSIRLAAFQASGAAHMKLHTSDI
jgi:hypothetical protein